MSRTRILCGIVYAHGEGFSEGQGVGSCGLLLEAVAVACKMWWVDCRWSMHHGIKELKTSARIKIFAEIID